MHDLTDVQTFSQLQKLFPDIVKVCCSIGFEYFNLDGEHFCKVAYYYNGTNITYDPRDHINQMIDYRKFKVMLIYTDDHELEA